MGEIQAEEHGGRAFVGPRAERLTVGELLDALEANFKLRGKDSRQNLSNLARVRCDFGVHKAVTLTAEQIDKYIARRLADGDAKASINRTTQLLNQAFKLAIERKCLADGPKISRLSEAGNVRKGFFSQAELRAVVDNLPGYLKDFVRFGYLVGWRKSEIASLRYQDAEGDVIRLRGENSKNGEPRMVPIEGELRDIIERCRAARRLEKANTVLLSEFVFHRNGQPIGDVRKAWANACRMAGIAGKLFHDLRRTAVRNMVRAGTPETVAMKISGHKTRSMFDRYNITSERDLREAMCRTQEYLAGPERFVVMEKKTAVQ